MGHRGHDPEKYSDPPRREEPMDPRECPFCGDLVKMLPSHLPDCDDAPV